MSDGLPGMLRLNRPDGGHARDADGTLMVGNSRVDLFTMYHPTPAAMPMNTTAPIASTTHGMPADTFRGGGAHGAP